jgi:hypothetical protein
MDDEPKVETLPLAGAEAVFETVAISSLVVDDRYQSRAAMDTSVIADYAIAIRQAGHWPFPPIKLVSQIVVDGFHRIEAAKLVLADPETSSELRRNLQAVPCHRIPVNVARDDVPDVALRHALASNHTHGLRRSQADKRRAVELALTAWPNDSDRTIGKLTGTSHTFVGKVRTKEEVATLPPEDVYTESPTKEEVATLPPEDVYTESRESCSGTAQSGVQASDSAKPQMPRRPFIDSVTDAMQSLGNLNKHLTACKSLNEAAYLACRNAMLVVNENLESLLEDARAAESRLRGLNNEPH